MYIKGNFILDLLALLALAFIMSREDSREIY